MNEHLQQQLVHTDTFADKYQHFSFIEIFFFTCLFSERLLMGLDFGRSDSDKCPQNCIEKTVFSLDGGWGVGGVFRWSYKRVPIPPLCPTPTSCPGHPLLQQNLLWSPGTTSGLLCGFHGWNRNPTAYFGVCASRSPHDGSSVAPDILLAVSAHRVVSGLPSHRPAAPVWLSPGGSSVPGLWRQRILLHPQERRGPSSR